MKRILFLIPSLLLAGAVEAKTQRYANCSIKIGADARQVGPCTVAPDTESVAIDISGKSYVISLVEDDEGDFLITPSMRTLSGVKKKGDCWTGANVEFCARR